METLVGGAGPWRSNLSCRSIARFWRQLRINQCFHLIPNSRIAFNFRVSFYQHPVEPGIPFAADGIRLIVKSKVPNNLRAGWIGCTNRRPAVNNSIRLVEINRLPHIAGNYCVVLPNLGDAIHLDGE